MENKSLGLLLAAFVMIIIGASLIGIIATQEQTLTTKITANNETVTIARSNDDSGTGRTVNTSVGVRITNYPTGWKTTDCPVTNLVVRNQTGETLTLNTDYNFTASTGVIGFLDTLPVNQSGTNTTGINYQYCPDNYMTQSWSRSVLDLVPGFFGLAIMGIGIALFFGVLKREGIINI